jgi:iron(III) transport system ATP-binding protein
MPNTSPIDPAMSTPTNTPLLSFEHVSHRYANQAGGQTTLADVSFTLEKGRIACLLGPSGCGKTTALRCIAGFEPVSAGSIHLAGAVVSSPGHLLAAQERHIGMVFQDYALFPHLDISANIGFGLHKWSKPLRQQRIVEMLETVGLSDLSKAWPHQLSGGQQQRVALARALAPKPELLLLDEPFSNLDVDLRERLSVEVRTILKQQATTAILVTHDQNEAFAIADEIGLLHQGKIQQWGSAYQLYHEPANRFVADFIGEGVFVPGRVTGAAQIELFLGTVEAALPPGCQVGEQLDVLIRPDDIIHDDHSPTVATVCAKAFRGASFLYSLQLENGNKVVSLVPSHHNHALGEKIGIRLEIDHVIAFR